MTAVKAWFTLSMLAAVVLGSFATGAAVTRIIRLSQPVQDAAPALDLRERAAPLEEAAPVEAAPVRNEPATRQERWKARRSTGAIGTTALFPLARAHGISGTLG